MINQGREVAGYFCRWALLGLAWASLAACACLGVAAVSSRQDMHKAVLSDIVSPFAPILSVPGKLIPTPRDAGQVRLLLSYGDKMADSPYSENDPFYLRDVSPTPGDYRINLIGMPYTYMMPSGWEAKGRMLARDERVFLVDASLAGTIGADSPAQWRRALEAMSRRGCLAFFQPGPAEEFDAFRAGLRESGIEAPVFCLISDKADTLASLWYAQSCLRAGGRKMDRDVVVTGSRAVAQSAAGYCPTVNWIVPRGERPVIDDNRVKVWADIESFAASLE